MPNFIYTRNIPDTPHNPSTDQPPMKINTNSTDEIIEVDHYSFNDNRGGYHKTINQPTGATTQNMNRSGAGAVYVNIPAAIATNNQIIAGLYTPDTAGGVADTQLFTQTNLGVVSQLTGALTTSTATSDGWQWVGSVLLQWGFVSIVPDAQKATVTFKDRVAGAIPFPNNCFFVGATITFGAGVVAGDVGKSYVGVVGSSVSTTGFTYAYEVDSDSSGVGKGFYWFAVGN